MDFFTKLIQQHPVTDRNQKNDFSQHSDEFIITKEKGLKGFNDDVSEIEIGSEQINEDSINEIKNQQRLLLCHEESIRKTKAYEFDSKQQSFESQQFGTINQDKKNKNLKDMKASIESKLLMKQFNTPQFANPYRQNPPNEKKQRLLSNLSIIKSKKVHSQMLINLTELKKIKSEIKEHFIQEQRNFKRLIEMCRHKLQIEIKRKFQAFTVNQQSIIRDNLLRKNQNSEQIRSLRQKLSQSKELTKELSRQLKQLSQQNEVLQQKLFDLEQKMVGVDLEVENRFDKKKKQLQAKITSDVLAKYHAQVNFHIMESGVQQQNKNPTIINLINQNTFLQAKIKSYEVLLLQTDHLRQAKQNIQEMQLALSSKQREIQSKQKQVDKTLQQTHKKSIDLEQYQQSLNSKLKQLQEKLNIKQKHLERWQLSLQQKTDIFNNSKAIISPKGETQKYYKTQHTDVDRPSANNKVFYDPKKHQKYQMFDINQKEKFYLKTEDIMNFKDKENRTERVTSLSKNFDPNLGHINRGSIQHGNKSDLFVNSKDSASSHHRLENNQINQPSSEIKKVTGDLHRPSTSNSYKYESQYVIKPPSSPMNSHKTFNFDSYRHISPHQRDANAKIYNKVTNNRLTVDYRDRSYQPSSDRSTISKSSMDNSIISGQSKSNHKISYQGFDMKKTKPKHEITKINDLGNKIQFLKSELKSQIDNIL